MRPYPVAIALENPQVLVIRWSDGQQMRYSAQVLRSRCPCAHCLQRQAEASQELLPVLQPHETGPVHITEVRPVGNYAYNICFSDQHTTGIYTLEYLRRLGQEGDRGPNPSLPS